MLKFQAGLAFLKDNVLSAVAALAALVYGYVEFNNKQANQEKQFIEQFAGAIEKFEFPADCRALSNKPGVYLLVANSAAGRLEQDFGDLSYRQILAPLAGRYAEFRAMCEARDAPGAADSEARANAITRSIAQSAIQFQEASRRTQPGALWFTVLASLPQGFDDEASARRLICNWRHSEPELENWQFQIWKTNISKSIAIVIDGEQSQEKAAQAAQQLRSNPRFRPYFYDAFAQINRDWARVADKVECAGGQPAPAPPAAGKSSG